MASQVNSTIKRRVNTYPPVLLKRFQENCIGRNASELILQDQHHSDAKTKQISEKRKL